MQEEEKARKASIASGGEVRTILFFEYIIVFKKFNLNYFYVLKTVGFCRKYYVFKPNLRAFQTENFKPKQKKECVKCCTFSFNQLKSLFEIAFQFLYHNNLSGIANSSVKFWKISREMASGKKKLNVISKIFSPHCILAVVTFFTINHLWNSVRLLRECLIIRF